MQLDAFTDLLRRQPAYIDLVGQLRSGTGSMNLAVLTAARPLLTMALSSSLERPIIYVASRVSRAYNIAEQLPVWDSVARVLRFAEPGPLFYERAAWSDNTVRSRLSVLAALCPPPLYARTENPIVVTSARALMQKTLPVREFRAGSRILKRGGEFDPEKLLRLLTGLGYEPSTITTTPGYFSRRGGIVDIFPLAAAGPVRLEFFGNEIESIRCFDPASQRSEQEIETVVITPAREALPRYTAPVAERLAPWFTQQRNPDEDGTSVRNDATALAEQVAFPELEFYLPYLYSHPAGLLDYTPDDALVIVDDWQELRGTVEEIEAQAVALVDEKRNAGELPPEYPLPYLTWDDLVEGLSTRAVLHFGDSGDADIRDAVVPLDGVFSPGPRFAGQLRLFIDHLIELQLKDEPAVVVTRQAQRLAELWGQQDTFVAPSTIIQDAAKSGLLQFVEGTLAEGWTLHDPAGKTHLLTDAEIFGWQRPEPRRLHRARPRTPEASFADLQPGNYVVHVEYGIGQFEGLRKRTLNGDEREYLVIQYAGTDQLFVPIHQADRLARYIGSTDAAPPLSRLGTPDWSRVKETTRKAVEEIAKELLELYARRASVKGHAFGADTPWQHELEASFPYVETDDQLRALVEVKQDMERSQPMDRLICGDVGYGKTEVALRAAFKAVMDGKQVAMLVPTTVLAQQHLNTFAQRLASFPLKVEMLSRFRDRHEQRTILYQLAEGSIDIIIGTHRLLQDDVQFKDLGLLIIDEEQRFGVTHKEKLKQMRTEVDVLTMTATPIPRTLYMALTGTRDISTIQTAPEERLPVNTHIGVYDRRIVKQAILREMERNGQIYFVHNRVQTIEVRARELQELVPEASIAIAHGQMDETELERVMLSFARGDYDVLVCTTIIESGVDIPNANTMIIDRADWFGMAQLYQLRGRVGRGAARAHAYFFHPSWNKLSDEAAQRLQTIREYNDLGAGFHVAMRDLEIRGAGDILGARQSGHIAAVGFHLYTQLLAQAVKQLKNNQPLPEPEAGPREPAITIDLPLQAYIPTDYIADMGLRLQIYRRLADLHTEHEIDTVGEELADRFGPLPEAAAGLLYQLKVKLLAQHARATGIGNEAGQVFVRLPYLAEVDRAALQQYLGNGARVSRTAVWLPRDQATNEWQALLLVILKRLDRQPERAPRVA